MAHGTYDPVVHLAWAQASRDVLERGGWNVEWHEYPMEHSAMMEEVAVIGQFLQRVLQR
jgi:phospholipase/carboxylesterase